MATLDPERTTLSTKPVRYSVNLNVVLSGSKKMSEDELRHAIENEPQFVNVSITDPNSDKVLVNGIVEMIRFSTGSIGYSLQRRDVTFKESE